MLLAKFFEFILSFCFRSFFEHSRRMECNLNARALRTLLSSLQNQEDFEEEIKKAAKTTKGETPIPEELHDFRLQVLGTLLHETAKTGKFEQLLRLVDDFSAPMNFRLHPRANRFRQDENSQNQKGLSLLESSVIAPSRVSPECVKYLLKQKCFSEEDKKNAVTLSVTGARSHFLEALIENGVNVNFISDAHQNSPLLLAALRSDGKSLKLLLDGGADIAHVSESGGNAVMKILSRDSGEDPEVAENLEMLIQAGTNVTNPDKHGDTPLIKAARQRCHLCMKILLKHIHEQRTSENIFALNQRGRTAIEECISNADNTALALLLETKENGGGGITLQQYQQQQTKQTNLFSYLVESQRSVHSLQAGGVAPSISPFSFPTPGKEMKSPVEVLREGQKGVCELLLKGGVDAKEKDQNGKTTLHYPLPLCCVELLVQAGAPLAEEDNEGVTPFKAALQRGDKHLIQLWIQKKWMSERDMGALRDYRTEQGETYLHLWAGFWEFAEEFSSLIETGISVDVTCQNDTTAMERAIENDIYTAVEALLPKATITKKHLDTALKNLSIKSIALLLRHPESRKELEKEDLPSIRNSAGENLLHMVVEVDASDAISILVEMGVEINYFPPNLSEWDDGGTPLHAAAMKGRLSCLKELLENGAEIDSQNTFYQNTPLHLCCEHSSPACLKELIARGANQKITNSSGETAKDLAQMAVDGECFKILQQQ